MDFDIAPSLLITSLIFFITLLYKYSSKSSTKLPTGPRGLPIIGNIHQLAFSDAPHRTLRDLAQRYGSHLMYFRLGQIDTIVVSSCEAAGEILKSQDLNFAFRPELKAAKVVTYNFSDIAYSSYSAYWRQLRKICTMELLSQKRVNSFAWLRADETMKMMRTIAASPHKPVNVTELLIERVNGIVSRASFGERCPNPLEFMNAMEEALSLAIGFDVSELFPSLKFLDLLSGHRFKVNRIHQQLDKMLDAIIKDHQENRREDEEHEDLIDVLLKCKERADLEFPLTFDNIKAVIMDIFGGGTDTSSSTMVWAMSELMKNPKEMEKTQRDVREAMYGKTTIDHSSLSEMNYLKLVIKETLRLHPPIPLLIPRETHETCQVLGYTVPAKTRVLVNTWALQRDPQYWEDAESFKPERFLRNSMNFQGNQFEYMPFGAGRRICPSITFANATMEFALAHLLFYFDWQLPHGMKVEDLDMNEKFHGTVSKKTHLSLIAIPRYPLPPI